MFGGPRICIDIDEVICPMIRPLLRRHGAQSRAGYIKRYRYAPLLGVTDSKCIELVREYYQSPEFLQAAPFPGVPEALEMASGEGKVFLVSARQWYAREATERWLDLYNLSRYAEDLVLCNSFSADGSEVAKADMLQCLGGSVLIDDSEETLREAMERGVGGSLCVQRGLNTWSEGSDLPKCHDLLDGVSQIFNLGYL